MWRTAHLLTHENIALQHTSTHCTTLQRTATHCNTLIYFFCFLTTLSNTSHPLFASFNMTLVVPSVKTPLHTRWSPLPLAKESSSVERALTLHMLSPWALLAAPLDWLIRRTSLRTFLDIIQLIWYTCLSFSLINKQTNKLGASWHPLNSIYAQPTGASSLPSFLAICALVCLPCFLSFFLGFWRANLIPGLCLVSWKKKYLTRSVRNYDTHCLFACSCPV